MAVRHAVAMIAMGGAFVLSSLWTPSSAIGAPAALAPGEMDAKNADAANQSRLESAKQSGDLRAQRHHIWQVIAGMTRAQAKHRSEPRFESWYGEEYVFGDPIAGKLPRGIRGFSRPAPSSADGEVSQSGDASVLNYTLYNPAAYEHIRENHLYKTSELQRLNARGSVDSDIQGDRAVPAFPAESIVLKTVWWPVAHHGITSLPVWDPELNPPRRGGNGYPTWARVVAVDPLRRSAGSIPVEHVDFAGRSFANVRRIGLERFYHVKVDAQLAERLMHDPDTKKAVLIALGRTIKPGDYLILVAANLATKELKDWVWAAVWWHDRPNQGPFADGRPPFAGEWRNYLVQVAFDPEKPVEPDAGPHICFNPWLEGRFPDGGHGGGTVSNCMACHRRASFPMLSFLPVTRGAPHPHQIDDPAFAPGRLRTSFLWALSMHAR